MSSDCITVAAPAMVCEQFADNSDLLLEQKVSGTVSEKFSEAASVAVAIAAIFKFFVKRRIRVL